MRGGHCQAGDAPRPLTNPLAACAFSGVRDVDREDAGAAARDDHLDGLALAQVLLDVDLVGWDEEEVAGLDVDAVLEPGAEVEAGMTADDVDRCLAVAVVVDAGGHTRR